MLHWTKTIISNYGQDRRPISEYAKIILVLLFHLHSMGAVRLFFIEIRQLLLNTAFNDNTAKTDRKLPRDNVSSCQWLATEVIGLHSTTNVISNIVINTTAIPEFAAYAQNKIVRHRIIMGRRDTKKQAWISNVVGEKKSYRQTAEAAVVHNKSHLKPRTGSLCAWNILTLFMLLCQYLTKPLWSAVSIQRSLWLHIIVRTAVSWACVSHTQTHSNILSNSIIENKKAQLTQGLRATGPSFQYGRQPPSWILSNRLSVTRMYCIKTA